MMRPPRRLQVKLFDAGGASPDLAPFVALFHGWIQRGELEDLLVDVHDYKHIHEGPGILLVGHEGDYAFDLGGGRRGLLYRLKRSNAGSLGAALKLAFRRLMTAATCVENDSGPGGTVTFSTREFEIQILDRLRYPNQESLFNEMKSELSSVMHSVLGGVPADLTIERIDNDPREPLAVRVLAPHAPALKERAGVPEPAASDQPSSATY